MSRVDREMEAKSGSLRAIIGHCADRSEAVLYPYFCCDADHSRLPRADCPCSDKLSPEQARRVEVLIRSKSNIPPEYELQISGRSKKSEVPGFDEISVIFTANGKSSKPMTFLAVD